MAGIIQSILHAFGNTSIKPETIIAVLIMAMLFSVFEYLVYRFISHRAFYNKAFNICIALLPAFISTIILSLQSNTVVILGTIGALAILRFRTAVKDPVDMLYLMWSVHIGITCGCQLYLMTFLTCVFVTIVLTVINHVTIGKRPFILVIRNTDKNEKKILSAVKACTQTYRIKSRNYTKDATDYVIELSVNDSHALAEKLGEAGVEKFSVIEYDSEDIL